MENRKLSPQEENQVLEAGYHLLTHEHYPIGAKPEDCHSPENAYFFNLEKENLKIPYELTFYKLKPFIPEELQPQIQEIWENIQRVTEKYTQYVTALITSWENAPIIENNKTEELLAQTPYKITETVKKTIFALLEGNSTTIQVQSWQISEKGIRRLLYEETKKLIVSIRLYYEFLLVHKDDQYVLPKDHSQRQKIADKNNYLRLIQIKQEASSIAKTGHHNQKKGRLRKHQHLPYLLHTEDVSNATIMDIIPFTIEGGITFDFILMAIVTSLHDLEEDTDLNLEDITVNYLKRLTDGYDSSIDPLIKLPFSEDPINSRKEFKEKALNLMKKTTITNFKKVMRVLSSTTKWSAKEKIEALRANIAGKDLTTKLLDISEEEEKKWQKTEPQAEPKTPFQMFPEEQDSSKMTKFLIRLNSMTTAPKMQQMALIVKVEDRAHNILTSDGFTPEKKRAILRETTTRLIAWCITEHKYADYPLYNALPRLLNITIEKYQKLQDEHPETITDFDETLITQLQTWRAETATENLKYTLPIKVQTIISQWEDAHNNLPPQTPQGS